MNLSLLEQIMYATLQIEMLSNDEKTTGWATGFLVGFCREKASGISYPALVTNRHVLGGCPKIRVVFTRMGKNNEPMIQHTVSVIFNTSESLFHPKEDIDLAVLPIGQTLNKLVEQDQKVFTPLVDLKIVPSPQVWESFDAIENITMVGFPRGLRDTVNNLPIFRRGITATHPAFNYCGKPIFLADMACFKGSSGSPVYLIDSGSYFDKQTNRVKIGSRVYLLGVQYAVPNLKDFGVIFDGDKIAPSEKPVMQAYINLGMIVKSTELLVFESMIRRTCVK